MPNYDNIQKSMAILADAYVLQYLLAENFKSKPDLDAASKEFITGCGEVSASLRFDQLDAFERDLAAQLFQSALVTHALRARALAAGIKFDKESPIFDWPLGGLQV